MFTRKFKLIAAGALAACTAGAVITATSGQAATGSSTFPLADPDTVHARDGKYLTYGTNVGRGAGPRCGAPSGRLFVPYLAHGRGSTVGMSNCAAGDAMPGGPGAWADRRKGVWAPGVVKYNNRYYLFYSATKAGTGSPSFPQGQKCIGVADSYGARGPFRNQRVWACPPRGRWAIDANPFVSGGRMYVAYRDDAITGGRETGISVVRTRSNGSAIWKSRRDALKSTDITWDTARTSGGSHIVENPSMFKHRGTWYLAYSGNNWDSWRYSTGIASCGSKPIPSSRCKPMRRGVARPYFGWRNHNGADLAPYRTLPGNHRGPGGLDVFRAANGSRRAVWHWWRASDRTRHVKLGPLRANAGGFYVA